jgi:hypothetical protein
MNAQDAPAFGDEPSDEGGGGGGGQALRATPTASPVAALFETQPRGGTAGGQAARGDRRVEAARRGGVGRTGLVLSVWFVCPSPFF